MGKQYTYKNWNKENIYDFYVEFNRIEGYNEYCKQWLKYFGIKIDFISKTDWTYNDIVDIKDFNRVKHNINIILNAIGKTDNLLQDNNYQYNQTFNDVKANEIEEKLKIYLKQIGEWQFTYNMCGLTTCGNSLKLGGIN